MLERPAIDQAIASGAAMHPPDGQLPTRSHSITPLCSELDGKVDLVFAPGIAIESVVASQQEQLRANGDVEFTVEAYRPGTQALDELMTEWLKKKGLPVVADMQVARVPKGNRKINNGLGLGWRRPVFIIFVALSFIHSVLADPLDFLHKFKFMVAEFSRGQAAVLRNSNYISQLVASLLETEVAATEDHVYTCADGVPRGLQN